MNAAETIISRRSFGQTMRADLWWIQPLLVFLGLSIFIVYSTWAAFQGAHYFFGNYISPFYSPEIFGESPHSWFVVGALGPRRLSAHLLLLSRCLLQVVLGRSAGMHRGGTSKDLSGRTFLPPDYAKRTPLFSLSRVHLSRHPHDRCLEGTLVCRCYQREKFIWYRHRNDCARHQCCSARWLYLWLSFSAAFGRGISRSVFKITKLLPRLRMRELFQSPPHALGMAQFVLGRLRGSLRPILLDGCLA